MVCVCVWCVCVCVCGVCVVCVCVVCVCIHIRYRPSATQFPIIVSQDCAHGPTEDVVKGYGDKVILIKVVRFTLAAQNPLQPSLPFSPQQRCVFSNQTNLMSRCPQMKSHSFKATTRCHDTTSLPLVTYLMHSSSVMPSLLKASADHWHDQSYHWIFLFYLMPPSVITLTHTHHTHTTHTTHTPHTHAHHTHTRAHTHTHSHPLYLALPDDLDVSPDFFSYFSVLRGLLDRDPTIWCVSAWNDNGKAEHIDKTKSGMCGSFAIDLLPLMSRIN